MNAPYRQTDTILDQILAHTVEAIAARKQAVPMAGLIQAAAAADPPRDLIGALRAAAQPSKRGLLGRRQAPGTALIAEVKHASPSRGVLIEPFEPVRLARCYADNGAAAISVLTDERFFQGHLEDLRAVRAAVPLPVLRKDFIIDPYQVYEGRAAGADAMLLIVAALSDAQLASLHALITALGMMPLVEVHNEAELERALAVEPLLLGFNNRDLKTFDVDLATTARLAALIPDGLLPDIVTLVAESGVFSARDAAHMARVGAHAVLVGESLVQADDISAKVRELSGA